jgi:hemerythrin superfamily protein
MVPVGTVNLASKGSRNMASQDIFSRLKEDHDSHRALLARLERTHGDSDERRELFERFTIEVKGHASAEEQALYSTMMRKPQTTDDTRHSVAEHHEIEEMLNDLAATDMASGAWLTKFRTLQHGYLHHIDEEEGEHFPEFSKYLTKEDEAHMKQVFDRRKKAEKADAQVTPEKMEDAKE